MGQSPMRMMRFFAVGIAGGILTALGSGTLLTSLVYCPLHAWSEDKGNELQSARSDPGVCIATMLGIGSVVLVGGIFLLAEGIHRRRIRDQWQLSYGVAEHVSFLPIRGGAMMGWATDS
jgi:hypothetical protein